MLKKKKCGNCNEGLKSSYAFCPSCGVNLKSNSQKNWGILGKRDVVKETPLPNLFGGLGGKMMNKMIGSAMKMIEKEMMKEGNFNINPNQKIKLMINGKEINPEKIKEKKPANTKVLPIEFSQENLKKWGSLKKKEPKTDLMRIDDQIKSSFKVPGVKTIKDVSIVKLESGIEVKAVSEKEAYLKKIPINLPLSKYSLLKGVLTLDLEAD